MQDLSAKIAVVIPCYNEEATIRYVITEFRHHLPTSIIYVYNNNSTDNTARIAYENGAIVRTERLQGKGNVVRRMFADIDADIYVMVDGDATYDAASAPAMVHRMLTEQLDMVTAIRQPERADAYRSGHRLGNRMFSTLVATIFGDRISDLLSGYRVLSRRFVKSFPVLSGAFEIETELTVHALELRMPLGEVITPYGVRPDGSMSKLSTYRDGLSILQTIFTLVKNERPMPFFCGIGVLLIVVAVILSIPLFVTYVETGLVPRFPTAILVTGMSIVGVLSAFTGLIIDSVTRGRQELKRLRYLAYGPVPSGGCNADG